jgi:hypothetical protein
MPPQQPTAGAPPPAPPAPPGAAVDVATRGPGAPGPCVKLEILPEPTQGAGPPQKFALRCFRQGSPRPDEAVATSVQALIQLIGQALGLAGPGQPPPPPEGGEGVETESATAPAAA